MLDRRVYEAFSFVGSDNGREDAYVIYEISVSGLVGPYVGGIYIFHRFGMCLACS